MAIGKFRCIVMNVTDLELGERFWSAVTGLLVRFSAVGYPTRYSRLGDIKSHSILLQLVSPKFSGLKIGSTTSPSMV